MKTTRVLLALFSAMTAASIASSQVVEFIMVSKRHLYTQTTNGGVVDATNPWSFRAAVEVSSGSISQPTLSIPSGTGSTTMIFDSFDNSWVVEQDFANSGLLDGAYGNGNYSMTALSQTVSPISLTGDTFPVAPIASLSGGTISGGVLIWNPNTALTITINGTGIDHMGVFVFGGSYSNGLEGFGVTTQSFTVPAFTMTVGQSYTVELSFDDIVGGTAPMTIGSGALLNAQYGGVYTAQTKFTIQAVPEPSTYAAIFGALALAGVMIQRRRRRAA